MTETALIRYPTALPVKAQALANRNWKGVVLHAVTVACVILLYLSIDSPSAVLILGGSLMFLTYFIIALRESRREPLWFTPLSFYFYWYTVGFGLSAIYTGIVLLSEEFISFAVAEVPAKDIATGYVISLIGSLALHTGLQLNRPVHTDKPLRHHLQGRNDYLVFISVLWIIGILAKVKPSLFSPLGALANPLQWVAIASLSTLALTSLAKLKLSKLIFAALLIIGVVGLTFTSLEANSKAAVMYSFFPIIWLFLINPPLRKWLLPLVVGLAVFYFVLVAPLIMSSRQEQLLEGESSSERIIRTFQSGSYNAERNSAANEEGQIAAFLSRQFDPIPVSFLVGEVSEYGLQLGETMDYAAYAFVPRILWRDKPTVTRGAWFATYLGFATSEEESTTSIGITATGELYWNFGIIGVIAGMFTLGVLISGLWRLAGTDPRNKPFHMILYCMVMLGMPDMPEAVTVFVSIIINFLIFKTLFFFIERRNSKPGRSRAVAASTVATR